METQKWVYLFSQEQTDGNKELKNLLGGKGANLAEMASLKCPVPPGFTITTEVCTYYYNNKFQYPQTLEKQVKEHVKKIEKIISKKFGSVEDPLLVSVRSGSSVSMPGMMDTILNLGLNEQTVVGLAKKTNNPRFAFDSYRRFIQMFGDVVKNIPSEKFEHALESVKSIRHVQKDNDLSESELKELILMYQHIYKKETGKEFPEDVYEQMWEAVGAVFKSWNNDRAKTYRNLHGISHDLGTAVNIQSMVFGNMGDTSATGVAFTRDPSTGEKRFFGEYLINAQGEDVVAGIRTPFSINGNNQSLEMIMPNIYTELHSYADMLEAHFKDMQDIEFTIQDGKLWLLQTRSGKRTAKAAIKIATDLVKECVIDKKTAVLRVTPEQVDQLLHPSISTSEKKETIAKGLPASPGAATGKIVFDAQRAYLLAQNGEKVLLVRNETSPEDIHGMNAAQGIITARGGMTSHAAVVARGMGKPCVVSCQDMFMKTGQQTVSFGNVTLHELDILTIDGAKGEVYLGQVEMSASTSLNDYQEFFSWVHEFRKLKVRANADTPKDAKTSVEFGAEGIGLCRTEHMFFEPDRIQAVREMILSDNDSDREKALAKLLPIQKNDFYQIFSIMAPRPVTVRLLDPPLHEFLPQKEEEFSVLANTFHRSVKELKEIVERHKELNPMLGHRGCRLGITAPTIYIMQVKAIFLAMSELIKQHKSVPVLEIMVPLVGNKTELNDVRVNIEKTAQNVMQQEDVHFHYHIGTMIEVPRAAITADEIATIADFFSFGTNDLTQTTLGFSRDDIGTFLPQYLEKGILEADPFATIDKNGVGVLVKMAIEKGKAANPKLHFGVCGEHGGDPKSVAFFHSVHLDYVSCSPYRIPIAMLAAAHAAIRGV